MNTVDTTADTAADATVNAIVETTADFADHLIDQLAPPGTNTPGGDLARLTTAPSRIGGDDRLLLGLMVELVRVHNLVTTALAGLTAAADTARTPVRKGLKTGADLLKELGVPPAVAYRLARVGKGAPALPDLARQARIGAVPLEHADAIGQGVAFVGKRVTLDQEATEDLARRLAAQASPADIERRARELALEWAPPPEEQDPEVVPVAEDPDLNELTIVTGADGRTTATADLDALTSEELHQALDPLCKPVLQPDGSPDPRSATRRRADALGHLIRDYLSGRDRPRTAGGVVPHVTLIVPTALEALTGDGSAHHDSPVASFGFTGPVSPATVGLVLCEAAMRRVVMDAESAPLDVGREMRLVSAPLRKALEARDRGCAFPGCGRPPSWTDAHHCTPWSEGGDTAIDNCVLLCRMHHTVVHHTAIHHAGWEVFIGHDRHPWFRPPVDPDQPRRVREPIRSHARRTLTVEPTAAA